MPDEGLYSYLSMDLARQWHWKFFFTHSQNPPLTNWGLSLFYRIFTPSLQTLWLFPALVSLAALLAAGWMIRRAYPVSFAFFLCAIAATAFPLLYAARFCEALMMVLSWTLVTLAALALYAQGAGSKKAWKGAAWLGFWTGTGFFVAIQWVLVAFVTGLAVFHLAWKKPSQRGAALAAFLPPVVLGAGIYGFFWLEQKGGGHIHDLWVFQGGTDWSRQVWDSLANLTCFWTASPSPMDYGPVWGGLLNPVLGACFLWGLVECFRHRRKPWAAWLVLGFLLFLVPGFAAAGFQVFRVVPAFPLALFLAALGLQGLAGSLSPQTASFRAMAVVLLLAASASLDFLHLEKYHSLWGTPGPFWQNIKSGELYEAYVRLGEISKDRGCGMVLSELRPNPTDLTLETAAYPFDAAQNAGIPLDQVKWLAVIVNANDKPFLERRFPEGKWIWLEKFSNTTNQPQMLAVIPVTKAALPALRPWVEANFRLKPLTYDILNSLPGRPQKPFLDELSSLYPFFQGDRFLESCFWEKVVFHCKADNNQEGVLRAVQEGLKKGYPLPQFFNDEGYLLEQMGKKTEARRAFLAAIHSPLNFTPAAQNLAEMEKGSPAP